MKEFHPLDNSPVLAGQIVNYGSGVSRVVPAVVLSV